MFMLQIYTLLGLSCVYTSMSRKEEILDSQSFFLSVSMIINKPLQRIYSSNILSIGDCGFHNLKDNNLKK